MKILYLFIFVLSCSFVLGQKSQSLELQYSKIEFHVDGMNNTNVETAVINSINKFPDKILAWTCNIANETILITFSKNERAVDILELIAGTGYKPWYINQNGMKVVLVGTNKTEEHYIKP